jgi:dipeptidyl aminopeptidase/acylaminoacyl peptidase
VVSDHAAPTTPFHDLDSYLALPRLSGLALSPDGTRLVTGVSVLDAKRTRYLTALWELDPSGRRPARRLTRSAKGESAPVFLPDSSLLFRSARPDPEQSTGEDDAPAALWVLPADGGEARMVARRPGGITGAVVARGTGTIVVTSPTLPGSVTGEDETRRRAERKDRKVSAILHESYPVRYWDHDLGPDQVRLLVADRPEDSEPAGAPAGPGDGPVPGRSADVPGLLDLRDLTPTPGRALDEVSLDLTPDGDTVVCTWLQPEPGDRRSCLASVDVATGKHTVLLDDPELEFSDPRVSPDGTRVALRVFHRPTPETPPTLHLGLLDLADGTLGALATGWDRWPGRPVWTPDGSALLVCADAQGTVPVFRVDVATGSVHRLTGDHGAYGDLVVSPDGAWAYALRSAVDSPPLPVRLPLTVDGIPEYLPAGVPDRSAVAAAARPDGERSGSVTASTDGPRRRRVRTPAHRAGYRATAVPEHLPAPADEPSLPGRLTEVRATAADGAELRSWLVLPERADEHAPAPLLLWVHGGPTGSWNAWSWRWNPWLAAAAGYAVLLPDPALSTGYGQAFLRRGWGDWGGTPYTDLMTITDAAVARPDVDETRTGAMGGSFGGYMANWIAGHTDRFRGIVSHAGLWALDQFGPATDAYGYWRREMSQEMIRANSPHRFVDRIRTPMLLVHGDRDYRVPVGEAIRLWAELAERGSEPDGAMPHKFLYFPSENHWVLAPQHARVWYQTVFAFLAHTVLGEEWVVPDLLR